MRQCHFRQHHRLSVYREITSSSPSHSTTTPRTSRPPDSARKPSIKSASRALINGRLRTSSIAFSRSRVYSHRVSRSRSVASTSRTFARAPIRCIGSFRLPVVSIDTAFAFGMPISFAMSSWVFPLAAMPSAMYFATVIGARAVLIMVMVFTFRVFVVTTKL